MPKRSRCGIHTSSTLGCGFFLISIGLPTTISNGRLKGRGVLQKWRTTSDNCHLFVHFPYAFNRDLVSGYKNIKKELGRLKKEAAEEYRIKTIREEGRHMKRIIYTYPKTPQKYIGLNFQALQIFRYLSPLGLTHLNTFDCSKIVEERERARNWLLLCSKTQ